eukprot:5395603-Prymnesium_polylepis.1
MLAVDSCGTQVGTACHPSGAAIRCCDATAAPQTCHGSVCAYLQNATDGLRPRSNITDGRH